MHQLQCGQQPQKQPLKPHELGPPQQQPQHQLILGHLPWAVTMLEGRLITTQKPNWYPAHGYTRSVAPHLSSMCPSSSPIVRESLQPILLGVGTRGGTEAMGHAHCAALDTDASRGVLTINFGRWLYQLALGGYAPGGSPASPRPCTLCVVEIQGPHTIVNGGRT
jgi:hypothetical protein